MSVFFHSTMSAANPIWNMLTIGELRKPIYLMSQPANKLYMCTYTFVCTAPRSRRHGQWDFGMARHITESVSLCSTFCPPQMRLNLNMKWRDRHPRVIKHPKEVTVSFIRAWNATATGNQDEHHPQLPPTESAVLLFQNVSCHLSLSFKETHHYSYFFSAH